MKYLTQQKFIIKGKEEDTYIGFEYEKKQLTITITQGKNVIVLENEEAKDFKNIMEDTFNKYI